MTLLYLCEKPSQARDIAKILGAHKTENTHLVGKGLIVTWCLGHLLEMAPPEYYCEKLKPWRLEVLPIIPTKWEMNTVEKTKKQFSAIKKLLKEASEVVIATDADREGEVIAREILELCHYRGKVQRLWLSALDETSVKRALANLKPGHETEKLYIAGLARQRADWLVGMNLTMAATCLFGRKTKEVYSVGRVQTPTLKLVVDRDRSIEQFQSKHYFVLTAQFITKQQEQVSATWQVSPLLADEEGRCLSQDAVNGIANRIKNKTAHVYSFDESQKHQVPPLGLSLSVLQKIASSQFGLSAKQTLDTAQSLYETHKATTYPRTDCQYLPESQFSEATTILKALNSIQPVLKTLIDKCDVRFKAPIWNDKYITAHHAIIPTANIGVDYARFSEMEKQIYDLICHYYLAQFLGNYEYSRRIVVITCESESFKTTADTSLKWGWRQAFASSLKSEEEGNEISSVIPVLQSGEALHCPTSQVDMRKTQPPARFTEGTLIEAMKTIGKLVNDPELKKILKDTAGIGTEATRANILETLIKRGYLVREGKSLVSSPRGKEFVALLPSIITDVATTARWEQELDAIAQGMQTLDSFLRRQVESLQVMLQALAGGRKSIS